MSSSARQQIILVRLHPASWSYGQSSLAQARHCRLDPASSQHGAFVDELGVLHYFHIDVISRSTTELLSFQLQLCATDSAPLEPICNPWNFEFVPGQPGEVLIVQAGSSRILYASLPRQGSEFSDVFLFGSHTAPVTCVNTNGNIMLSGCSAGCLKLWRLADGQLADSASVDHTAAEVTAIECLGPLLVAAGTASGCITLYDTASGRLLAVQRLLGGHGPVGCMAAWLDTQLAAAAALAAPGPRAPDGDGVLPGPNVGLPWTQQLEQGHQASRSPCFPAALLAVASPCGWLRVYQASQPGPNSWTLLHSSSGSLAAPITAVAFSSSGDTLAVAGPSAQILSTEAVAVAAAGGQPGAVSLYHVNNSISSGQLQSAAAEQPLQLQLWHQWCLKSLPVGLAMLPSSGLQLMTGKELGAVQVQHLLVATDLGPILVLTASRTLEGPGNRASRDTKQQQQQQQQDCLASTSPQWQQEQQQPASADAAAPQHAHGGAAGGDVLDIAVRDLSAVAGAVAEGASLQESELETLLNQLAAEAEAALEAQVTGLAPPAVAEQAAAQPAATVTNVVAGWEGTGLGPGMEVAAGSRAEEALSGLQGGGLTAQAGVDGTGTSMGQEPVTGGNHQQQWQDISLGGLVRPLLGDGSSSSSSGDASHCASLSGSQLRRPGSAVVGQGRGGLEQGPWEFDQEATMFDQAAAAESASRSTSPAGSAGAEPAVANVAASSSGDSTGPRAQGSGCAPVFLQPSTLPTLRSWMDRAAALAAGTAGEGPTAAVDLEALAQEMQQQQEQERMQQQLAQHEPTAAAARSAAEVGFTDLQDSEQELPCESTFQDMIEEQLQQQHHATAAAVLASADQPPATAIFSDAASTEAAPSQPGEQAKTAAMVTSFDDVAAVGTTAAEVPQAVAFLGSAGGDDGEAEPQPRQLPLALQRPHSTGRPAQQQQPQKQQPQQQAGQATSSAASLGGISAAASAAAGGVVYGTSRPAGAWQAPAAVHVPPAQHATCTAWQQQQQHQEIEEQAFNAAFQQGQGHQQAALLHHHHQMPVQKQQQQVQERPQGVRERLNLRLRKHQQQQQQQQQDVAAAAVMPVSDHPLASAVANSSLLLARKIEEAEQVPKVCIDPNEANVVRIAVKLTDLDFDFDHQQYQDLPGLKDISTPTRAQKVVAKQLDARWVASRNLKPQMGTLFKPQDWQPGCVAPQVLVLPRWPTPQQVVQELLWPQMM